ncbi:hypothetical protein [Klebsiella pneumoniae]|uniref:hypothetical protein n=2 Tax=Enterobacteriaceae TaxID=543 RepID=UPI002ED3AFFD|nr:hypothetical protein [Klebsiella pneumoniae]
MQTIAIRRYDNYCPSTQSTQPLVDQMVRKSCGSFFLIEGPERPGELEVEKPYSLEQVFEWLRECPWQIERTVIANETAPQCPAI